jgi:hypothetical protein
MKSGVGGLNAVGTIAFGGPYTNPSSYISYLNQSQGDFGKGALLFGMRATSSADNPATEYMRLTNTGNFLIGSQTDANYRLDVSGSARITNGLTVTGSLKAASITGSLQGTATNALTASYVPGTIVKTYGSYPTGDMRWLTTGSYIYMNNIPAFLGSYCTLDLTIHTYYGIVSPVQIKLYASTNTSSSVVGDTLIGTYSASIGSTNPNNQQVYKLKRTFYTWSGGDSEQGLYEYYIAGANPTASLLSDESVTDMYNTLASTWYDPATGPIPAYLKITHQTTNAGIYNSSFELGVARITYNV